MVKEMLNEKKTSTDPLTPISGSVEVVPVAGIANYLDLIHLPAGAIAWLHARPKSQSNTAAMIAKLTNDAGIGIVSGTLLRNDRNVLVLTLDSGIKMMVYPGGEIGVNGESYAATPEAIGEILNGVHGDHTGGQTDDLVAPEMPGMTNIVGVEGTGASPAEVHDPIIDPNFGSELASNPDDVESWLASLGVTTSGVDGTVSTDGMARPERLRK